MKFQFESFQLTCAILFLIAVVQAIVVAIANPRFGNTALVPTGEIPRVGTSLYRRFRVGIQHARVRVFGQPFAVRASALGVKLLRFIVGNGKAKFVAAAVVVRTRMQAGDALRLAAVNFDPVKPIGLRLAHHDLLLLARQLVQPHDRIQPPVGDVHPIIVNDDGERVSDEP